MEVKGLFPVKNARLAVDSVLSSMKETNAKYPGLQFQIEFQLTLQPGALDAAAAEEFVNRVKAALIALPEGQTAGLHFAVQLLHPLYTEFAQSAQRSYETATQLIEPEKKLVLPTGSSRKAAAE